MEKDRRRFQGIDKPVVNKGCRPCLIGGCPQGKVGKLIELDNFVNHLVKYHESRIVPLNSLVFDFKIACDPEDVTDIKIPHIFQFGNLNCLLANYIWGDDCKIWIYYFVEGHHEDNQQDIPIEFIFKYIQDGLVRNKFAPTRAYPLSRSIKSIMENWKPFELVSLKEMLTVATKGEGYDSEYYFIDVVMSLKEVGKCAKGFMEHLEDMSCEPKKVSVLVRPQTLQFEKRAETKETVGVPLKTSNIVAPEGQKVVTKVDQRFLAKTELADKNRKEESANILNAVAKERNISPIPPKNRGAGGLVDIRVTKDFKTIKIYCQHCSKLVMKQVALNSDTEEENGLRLTQQVLQQLTVQENIEPLPVIPKVMSPKTMEEYAFVMMDSSG